MSSVSASGARPLEPAPRPEAAEGAGGTGPEQPAGAGGEPASEQAAAPVRGQQGPVITRGLDPALERALVLGRAEERVEVPVTEGLRGRWNELVANLGKLDKDLRLAERAEKELRELFAEQLARHAPDAPAEYRNALAAEMAKALRAARIGGTGIEELGEAAEGLLGDAAAYLQDLLTFKRTETRIRQEVAGRGGLNPGEDLLIAEQTAPAAEAIARTEALLATKTYADGKVRFDWKELFDHPSQFVERIEGRAGIRWERGDFRARVETRLEVLDPIRPDASVRLSGFAEVAQGRFSARVEGQATVRSIYHDPRFAGTADLRAELRYTDPRITARLVGDLKVPLDDASVRSWGASGRVDYRLNRREDLQVSAFAEGYVRGTEGTGPEYGGRFGLSVRW
ncbi:MAG: hypothetical protein KatS3mg102_1666 [Planctomycetota bacterium]|nr:MAG: hypothetical protein KatS3mg102_1666 [Planctomycetota bacterium]